MAKGEQYQQRLPQKREIFQIFSLRKPHYPIDK
ncbi:Uncharacterised protein [Vibrio cholerae]|nr:Uncharacterised protein [Vibrio cholerae]